MKSDEVPILPILLADTRYCKQCVNTNDGPQTEMRMYVLNE